MKIMIAYLLLGMAFGIAALIVDRAKTSMFIGYALVLAVTAIYSQLLAFGVGLVIGPVLFVGACFLIASFIFSGIKL